jgi:hypothetical protein
MEVENRKKHTDDKFRIGVHVIISYVMIIVFVICGGHHLDRNGYKRDIDS